MDIEQLLQPEDVWPFELCVRSVLFRGQDQTGFAAFANKLVNNMQLVSGIP